MMAFDESILVTALLENNATLSWSMKEGFVPPPESRQEIMALQTAIMINVARSGEDYLGKVDFILVRQQSADVFLFPVKNRPKRVFCVVISRPYDMDRLVQNAARLLDS